MVKSRILNLLPAPAVKVLKAAKRTISDRIFRMRSPESVFTRIYLKNEWGGAAGELCSGGGSTDHEISSAYIAMLGKLAGPLTLDQCHLVDLGCGDMRVGKKLIPFCGSFTGVDVVKPLIAHHQSELGSATVSFQHLDIIRDDLPNGDICLIRQVLQHLSNAQIARVLEKLTKYRHIFITEHLPSGSAKWTPNLDKPPGKGIRLENASGVDIAAAPFFIPHSHLKVVLEVPGNIHEGGGDPGVIRTILYTPDLANSAEFRSSY